MHIQMVLKGLMGDSFLEQGMMAKEGYWSIVKKQVL